MVVTSCMDNICRLWSETHLPEEAGIHHNTDDDNPESVSARRSSKHRIQRQKARFVQRFRHMRQSFAARTLVRQADKSEPGLFILFYCLNGSTTLQEKPISVITRLKVITLTKQ
jgi:hypothetical protein